MIDAIKPEIPSLQKSTGATLSTLQAGRGIAALAVVLFHANTFFIPERLYDGERVGRFFDFGYAGVEFFFVLSGFIMALVHWRDIGHLRKAVTFWKRRVLRILPFYWVCLFSLIALLWVQGGAGWNNVTLNSVAHSMFLVPLASGESLLLNVAWTLSHEFLFYIIFMVLIFNFTLGAVAFAIWMLGILSATFWGDYSYPFDFIFSFYNVLFVLGIASARSFHRFTDSSSWLMLISGCGLFLGVGLFDAYSAHDILEDVRTALFGIGAMLAITGVANLEMQGKLRSGRFWSMLGDASYAIYLVHVVTLPILTKIILVSDAYKMMPAAVALLVLVGLSTLAGILAHFWIEKALGRLIKKTIA